MDIEQRRKGNAETDPSAGGNLLCDDSEPQVIAHTEQLCTDQRHTWKTQEEKLLEEHTRLS